MALLCISGVAQYFADASRGTTFWQAVPWKTVVLFTVAFAIVSWASRRPLSPELEDAIRLYIEERSICRSCGSRRRPDDVFCSVCHRDWERAIALLLVAGVAWAAFLLVSVHRTR
jgi:hypothetical protein